MDTSQIDDATFLLSFADDLSPASRAAIYANPGAMTFPDAVGVVDDIQDGPTDHQVQCHVIAARALNNGDPWVLAAMPIWTGITQPDAGNLN